MKKVLLFSILILFTICSVLAYETIIIKYPYGELWKKVYYKKIGMEAILQYVPNDQSRQSWKRSIIVHSYKQSTYYVTDFISTDLARMVKTNPTTPYKYLKLTHNDAIAHRCTENYKNIKAQCEFYRVSRAHDGIITLHYINRDKEDFKKNFKEWYEIVKKARFYNSYWRNERTFNKSEYFEL